MARESRLTRARVSLAASALAAALVVLAGIVWSGAAKAARAHVASSTSQCGTKPGVKATGSPIKLGGIVTDETGFSFTDVTNMAAAYFACVNANGGINGHPIEYKVLTEQETAAQISSEANELSADHVLGIINGISPLECTVNQAYWKSHGYYVISSGIAAQCYSSPNSAAVNLGPRFSTDGAVGYIIKHTGATTVVVDQNSSPIYAYVAAGSQAIANAAHVTFVGKQNAVPLADPSSVAEEDVQAAGPNGAVVLDYTPPQALEILEAAQKLGIVDQVKGWGCSSPCNTDFLAKSLGSQWVGKLFVNSELLNPDTTTTRQMLLYKAILKQYGSAVSGGIGAFSEFGYTEAEIAVHALETITGAYTRASVNKAFESVTNYNTGMMCKPWTYGPYAFHIPDNYAPTVTPGPNGTMVVAQACQPIPSTDPLIGKYRSLVAHH